eukprot:jgi/Mesvir1/17618/Mv08844-RA.1
MGYTSQFLAHALRKERWQVAGTCRQKHRAYDPPDGSDDWRVFVYDDDDDEGGGLSEAALACLRSSTHVLVSVPPVGISRRPDGVAATYGTVLREMAAAGTLRWLGYLSSTSVYGDWGGHWVDEDCELRPSEPKAKARAAAEAAWLALWQTHGLPVHIFRLGGIYGPSRSILDSLSRDTKTDSQVQRSNRRFVSRCHVADICGVLYASMLQPNPGRVYNIVDDEPAPRGDVEAFARNLLATVSKADAAGELEAGIAVQMQELVRIKDSSIASRAGHEPGIRRGGGAEDETMGVLGRQAEKRVSNQRIKDELRYMLRYPNYRLGLLSLVDIRSLNIDVPS